MRSIQTTVTFPLSAVKPLDSLLAYRAQCLAATRAALRGTVRRRTHSPVTGVVLEPFGDVEGLAYLRCPETGSLFLADLPAPQAWAQLLADVSRLRHSPRAFHAELAQSRADTVYAPKVEWIRETLRMQQVERPRLLEVTTQPSDFTTLLRESGAFSDVVTVDDMAVRLEPSTRGQAGPMQAAVLLESLDRVDDPAGLLHAVVERLAPGGLMFVTALVVSGFDMAVLGERNVYLYPPDRANCFSLEGLSTLLRRAGLTLLEVSTPGVLDVEVVLAHRRQDPALPLSAFERHVLDADRETHEAFQAFLQQQRLSSFARLVAKKPSRSA